MYHEDDHISNLFRENEHLLDERPSRNAWAKLEGKLDHQKVHTTRRIYRFISTAAAVIAVVAMLAAIALFKNGDELMAEKEAEREAIAMNEQSTEFSVNDNASDWRKEYAPDVVEEAETVETVENRFETAGDEEVGMPGNSTPLVTNPTPNIENKPAKIQPPVPDIEEGISKDVNERVIQPEMTMTPPKIATNQPERVKKTQKAEQVIAEEMVQPEPVATRSKPTIPEKTLSNMDDIAISEASNSPPMAVRKQREKQNYENAYAMKKVEKTKKAQRPTIQTFNWLKGAWADNTTMGLSYEKWIQTDDKTLAAKGYLIQNGDTLYMEQMEIKQIRNKVFYIANFGTEKELMQFELISYINGVATFENPKSDFPRQITLQQIENGYTITFENNDDAKIQQLQYRNDFSKARATRRMTRSGY